MRSFATLATLATAAFAVVASALPTFPAAANDVTHLTSPRAVEVPKGGDVHVPNVERSATSPLALAIPKPKSHVSRHPGYQGHSVVEVVVDLTAQVKPLCDKLTAAISGDVEVAAAVDVSLQVLAEIKGHLVTAKADIQAAISVGVDLLVLDGQTLAVSAVAEVVANLVIAITTVLGLVVKVCASANVDALIKIYIAIGIELAVIISLVAQVSANLVVVIKPLLGVVADIIVKLDLKALIQVLVLQGGSHY